MNVLESCFDTEFLCMSFNMKSSVKATGGFSYMSLQDSFHVLNNPPQILTSLPSVSTV